MQEKFKEALEVLQNDTGALFSLFPPIIYKSYLLIC